MKSLSFLLVALLAACAPLLTTPPGFVELDSDHSAYDYRATSADGLVVSARCLDSEEGSLEFWVQAVFNEMRTRRAYAHLGMTDMTSKKGLKGKRLEFGLDQGKTPHLYYIAVYVSDDDLYVVEAGGSKELMTEHAKQVELALASLNAS